MIENSNRVLELQDEGSWALMIEESNAKAIQKYHGNMADLQIKYYLSKGNNRYYKDYLDVQEVSAIQDRMIKFLLNDEKYSECIKEIKAVLNEMENAETLYMKKPLIEQFDAYCDLLCRYIAYYNSVIADVFFEKIYHMVDAAIPKFLQFANKPLKDALFATNNLNLLSHTQTVDLLCLAQKYFDGSLSSNDVTNYVNKYRSTTSNSGAPNGVTYDEIMCYLHHFSKDELPVQQAFIENLHFRYQNSENWSKLTADTLNLNNNIYVLIRRTSELSYMKILMREKFQDFKICSRKIFLNELIQKIGKSYFDYMLISEIRNFILTGNAISDSTVAKRKELFVFELIDDSLSFLYELPTSIKIHSDHNFENLQGDVLIGSGIKRFEVKRVQQDEDGLQEFDQYISNKENKDRVAIITNVLRPFLVPKLKQFGVLITQFGGYTSHASVLCRELGISSIISVKGLMESLKDGDTIEINFDLGTIVKVDDLDIIPPQSCEALISLQSDTIYPREIVGSKAANLMRINHTTTIPKGFTLTSYALEHLDDSLIQREIIDNIASLNSQYIVIRSSHESEDRDHSSYAGLYESYVNVDSSDTSQVFSLIKKVYASGSSTALNEYNINKSGEMHVIIQEMIHADISGVLLTSIPHDGYEYLLNEYTVGDLCYLMQGDVTPATTFIRKLDILNNNTEFLSYPAAMKEDLHAQFYDLSQICIQLEKDFGHRLEIEWGITNHKIYIFQARFY